MTGVCIYAIRLIWPESKKHNTQACSQTRDNTERYFVDLDFYQELKRNKQTDK